MGYKAILDGKTVVPVDTSDKGGLMKWANAFEGESCHVGDTKIGNIRISTVFLGIDHGFGGRPLWFETMIFNDPNNEDYQERYETWEQAEAGHKRAVKKVRSHQVISQEKK